MYTKNTNLLACFAHLSDSSPGDIIPTSMQHLTNAATVGRGPLMRNFPGRVAYEPRTLVACIEAKLSAPRRLTSDVGVVV
jgi:hypothetical protein